MTCTLSHCPTRSALDCLSWRNLSEKLLYRWHHHQASPHDGSHVVHQEAHRHAGRDAADKRVWDLRGSLTQTKGTWNSPWNPIVGEREHPVVCQTQSELVSISDKSKGQTNESTDEEKIRTVREVGVPLQIHQLGNRWAVDVCVQEAHQLWLVKSHSLHSMFFPKWEMQNCENERNPYWIVSHQSKS